MNNEFSWSAAREARIDRAIDRAVREMMQVEPPPGLRRRVLARLNDADERREHAHRRAPRFLELLALAEQAVVAGRALVARIDALAARLPERRSDA